MQPVKPVLPVATAEPQVHLAEITLVARVELRARVACRSLSMRCHMKSQLQRRFSTPLQVQSIPGAEMVVLAQVRRAVAMARTRAAAVVGLAAEVVMVETSS